MQQTQVRHLRAVGPKLAGYLRPGKRDSSVIARLIDQGFDIGAGVVFDPPTKGERIYDVLEAATDAGLERILDPRSVELATAGGYSRTALSALPWAGDRPHLPADLVGSSAIRMVSAITGVVKESGATAVLAPSHYLDDLGRWLPVDRDLTIALRASLDTAGERHVAIYYPLVASLSSLLFEPVGTRAYECLSDLAEAGAIDALWLRIHPFGTSSSGPLSLPRYMKLAQRMHALGVPIVGERTGTVGLALMAFNAVGGIESSITFGDRYDHRSLLRTPSGTGFMPPPKVYLQQVGALVDKALAETLSERRGLRGRHQCGTGCCPRGFVDTIGDPRRHFVVTRASEIGLISSVPEGARAQHFLTSWVRPASDRMIQLERVIPEMRPHRQRLDNWRLTLTNLIEASSRSYSPVPTGKRLRSTA